MNIQHLYPTNDPLIAKHVNMLGNSMTDGVPDIVHIHGCWQYQIVRQAMKAHRQGTRIVLTPHGGLEPWMVAERKYSEKLYKTLLWQRQLVEHSYVIIAQGKMEAGSLKELGWNPRIEVIRNAVVTNTITPEAMAQQTQNVYRKVMDSNTVELLSDNAIRLMALLLKAGITGDERWITSELPIISDDEWRQLLIYANHENVRTTVDAGTRILHLHHSYIETDKIESYLPTNYKQPKVHAYDVAGIVKEIHSGHLTLRHLVELDRAIRSNDLDEEWIVDTLTEAHLLKYFRRLLQILTEQTELNEGFLPTKPLNDSQTQSIRKTLHNHLRI